MVTYAQTQNIVEAFLTYPFLKSLDPLYPNIMDWYINSVVPGLASGRDVLLLAKDGPRLAGVALGKRGDETKLRCIRVAPEFQQRGVGSIRHDRARRLRCGEAPIPARSPVRSFPSAYRT